MRIFQQTTKSGEVITWYGFSDSDLVECGQHVIVVSFMKGNPVAFNNEDGTLDMMHTIASDDYRKVENPN